MEQTFAIRPTGAFALTESIRFGFGQRQAGVDESVMRLAFCLDGYREQVGVTVRQDAAGVVQGIVRGAAGRSPDVGAVRAQVARSLSLDKDATAYEQVGQRDPVIARLLTLAPGLRPPLFYSPYEAAIWSVLSARRPARQMAAVRTRLSAEYGTTFELAGTELAALPTPEQLLRVRSFTGIPPVKLARMHTVARAALDGKLDTDRLTALGPDAAALELQRMPGIGPFYSSLIVIRGTGFADVLPSAEPKLLARVRDLYGLHALPGAREFEAIAERWRPMRTWVSVLIRATAARDASVAA